MAVDSIWLTAREGSLGWLVTKKLMNTPARADVVNDGQHEHGDVEDASVVIHTGQNAEQPTQGFVLYLLLIRFTRKQCSTH